MECGQKLLGLLELGGAVLFTSGLAIRAVIEKINSGTKNQYNELHGKKILILGTNRQLGHELIRQFIQCGSQVAYAGAKNYYDAGCKFFQYIPSSSKKLDELAKQIEVEFGDIDILVYSPDLTPQFHKEALDELVDVIDVNLVEHFRVVSKFVPNLAKRSGRFVTIEPQKNISGTFSATNKALSALSDTLIQQMTTPGSGLKVTRAFRRTQRRSDQENMEGSVTAIINAVQSGRRSVTVPTAKQHIKNTLRYIMSELWQLWSDTIMREHKLTA